jgi:Rrf2 family protein
MRSPWTLALPLNFLYGLSEVAQTEFGRSLEVIDFKSCSSPPLGEVDVQKSGYSLSALTMITKTTLSAIRVLQHLAHEDSGNYVSPRAMARILGESPTYLAKVVHQLSRAGILRAERGASGGVRLGRVPAEITLLDIVEASQGNIAVDHCQSDCPTGDLCAYHRAAAELRASITGVLSHWTLAQLISKPESPGQGHLAECRVAIRRLAPALTLEGRP